MLWFTTIVFTFLFFSPRTYFLYILLSGWLCLFFVVSLKRSLVWLIGFRILFLCQCATLIFRLVAVFIIVLSSIIFIRSLIMIFVVSARSLHAYTYSIRYNVINISPPTFNNMVYASHQVFLFYTYLIYSGNVTILIKNTYKFFKQVVIEVFKEKATRHLQYMF